MRQKRGCGTASKGVKRAGQMALLGKGLLSIWTFFIIIHIIIDIKAEGMHYSDNIIIT